MKKFVLCLLLVASFGFVFSQGTPYFEGQVLVQIDKGHLPGDVARDAMELIGILPEFNPQRCISTHMGIWLFTFNENEIAAQELLRVLSRIASVKIAQLNHKLSERETTPDDPFYANQWYHNDAQDNDIDSDLAWDITTGGTTVTGDEIVACVVETGGASWDHIDLAANHWINENEIPSNGIDDDENGYVDDYDGWNIGNDTDNISAGNHGTAVSSMIGAVGNNNTGISGVNWNVKLMQVQLGSISEANVIEAYTYPMLMRKMYNETSGAKGAFVVVTNSSWGIDGGQPSESPLWCAMYDSLGTYGVLSCGATANNNVNVDVVGDLPTACPSEYMIAVTATDASDIRDFSGYGITTIDLGAPGDQVYLASNTNNYNNTSGTSFASPCVAGGISLVYSAPCISLMTLVYSDPAAGALAVRDYILEGIDPVANLADEVVTGGRLNVNNSLLLVMDECNTSGCVSPFLIEVVQESGTLNYDISWGITENMMSFVLRYKPVDDFTWIEFETLSNGFTIDNLNPCTEYEIQLMAFCDSGESDWSESITWTTDGCCDNPSPGSFQIDDLTEDGFVLSWEEVLAADSYDFIISDSLGFSEAMNASSSSVVITGLEPCTQYSITVQSLCTELESSEPIIFEVSTPGCLDCNQFEYCSIDANANAEWIGQVQLNTINNVSGADGGYGDYTDLSTTLDIGATYEISLTPGYSSASFGEYFKVWIDYNLNGVFDENELVFDAGDTVTETVTGSFMVPWTGIMGSTTMRVGMSWVGSLGGGGEPVPCGSNDYGETEDYCLFINTDVGTDKFYQSEIGLYPNPSNGIFVVVNAASSQLDIFNANGSLIWSQIVSSNNAQIHLENIASGIYSARITGNTNQNIRFVIE